MSGIIRNGLDENYIISLAQDYEHLDENLEKNIAIRRAAQSLINTLNINEIPIPVEDIVRSMGFTLLKVDMQHPSISAFIVVDDKMIKDFGNNKIVAVNKNDSVGHQRFSIAHEIAHYIYDYDWETPLYDLYDTNAPNEKIPEEKRANLFAAELMVPSIPFLNLVDKVENQKMTINEMIMIASKYFDVPTTTIIRRLGEVGKEDLLSNFVF